jgi:hypothetical protein
MVEKILYGPVEFLPPVAVNEAILEIEGVKATPIPYTTYVFLDEVHGEDIEELMTACNYAGCFSRAESASTTVRLDITKALNHALGTMPNFHIVFLTRHKGANGGGAVFGFKHLEILHEYPDNTDFKGSTCVFHH